MGGTNQECSEEKCAKIQMLGWIIVEAKVFRWVTDSLNQKADYCSNQIGKEIESWCVQSKGLVKNA